MKCPYCNAENTEQAMVCKKCYAVIPKILSESTNENSVQDRENKESEGETLRARHKKRSDN